jgi:hypothetical protein
MHTVIRVYRNAGDLMDRLVARRADVEKLISGVPGFVGYYLVRSANGGASVTVCDTKEGTDESTRLAAEWIRTNLPTLGLAPPEIIGGETVISIERKAARTTRARTTASKKGR